ncbi:hypothetical protein [Actinoplanes sp. NPDC020271]|uniref:hypothetical protein n=1 Tax=Actinoplanes sp. NPDC020271 TaxID=3363896 RepID=UPI0037B5960D
MPGGLYALLAQHPANPNEPERRLSTDPDERRPSPSTIYTASIETIDNDRATPLLGNISL